MVIQEGQKENVKIGLVGIGYWGKILLNNLKNKNLDIIICDTILKDGGTYEGFSTVSNFKNLNVDIIIIATPALTHASLCRYFLNRGKKVLCEKPLDQSSKIVEDLYNLAEEKETLLMIDWTFIYNSEIMLLKQIYENGKLGNIRSIRMNRLNYGPVRLDINAKWDLASQDVSIIQYIFNNPSLKKKQWLNYKKDNSIGQDDSCIGLLQYENFVANIHCSWYHLEKERECVFEFDKGLVKWDDNKGILEIPVPYNEIRNENSSLYKVIDTFLNRYNYEDMIKQKKLTKDITEILNEN